MAEGVQGVLVLESVALLESYVQVNKNTGPRRMLCKLTAGHTCLRSEISQYWFHILVHMNGGTSIA